MAKPYPKRPAPKPKRPLWPILVIFGALTLVVTGVIALTRQPAMQPAGVTLIASPGPRVAVDRQKVDFGQVKMDTPVTAAFKVKNVGSQPLQILGQPQVRVVEGC